MLSELGLGGMKKYYRHGGGVRGQAVQAEGAAWIKVQLHERASRALERVSSSRSEHGIGLEAWPAGEGLPDCDGLVSPSGSNGERLESFQQCRDQSDLGESAKTNSSSSAGNGRDMRS